MVMCRYVHELLKYEFDFEFDIPATYPVTAPEICIPELDGKTAKMYRGACCARSGSQFVPEQSKCCFACHGLLRFGPTVVGYCRWEDLLDSAFQAAVGEEQVSRACQKRSRLSLPLCSITMSHGCDHGRTHCSGCCRTDGHVACVCSPHFGLAHALCLGLAPWLAAEVPHLVDTAGLQPKS